MRLQPKTGAPEGRWILYATLRCSVPGERKGFFFSCHQCSLWPKAWDIIALVVACIISTLLMLIQLLGSFENLVTAFDSWPSVAVKSIKWLFCWCSRVFPLVWILYCLCFISLSLPPPFAQGTTKALMSFCFEGEFMVSDGLSEKLADPMILSPCSQQISVTRLACAVWAMPPGLQ